ALRRPHDPRLGRGGRRHCPLRHVGDEHRGTFVQQGRRTRRGPRFLRNRIPGLPCKPRTRKMESVFTKEARARSRESRLLRTESQEIRKQPSHRLALRWENETTHRDPESAREAIAPCEDRKSV